MHKIKNSMKILAVLMTLGVPIASIVFIADAAPGSDLVSYADLSSDGLGTSVWSTTESYSGGYAVHFTAPGKASWDGEENKGVGVNEGRLSIRLAPGTKLSDIESLSWRAKNEAGYPPHVDLLLDMDGDGDCDSRKDLVTGEVIDGNDDDALVAEFAYQEYVGSGYEYVGPGDPYSPLLSPRQFMRKVGQLTRLQIHLLEQFTDPLVGLNTVDLAVNLNCLLED